MTHERPRLFFGFIAVLLTLLSLGLAVPVLHDFYITGEVKRFPTAFLCVGLILLAAQVWEFGALVHSVRRARVEAKRLAYLAQASHQSKKQSEKQP